MPFLLLLLHPSLLFLLPPSLLLHMLLLALTVSGSLGRHYIAMFEAKQNVMLKPTESWREALLDTRVMDLFFTVSDPPQPSHSQIVIHLCLLLNYFFLST